MKTKCKINEREFSENSTAETVNFQLIYFSYFSKRSGNCFFGVGENSSFFLLLLFSQHKLKLKCEKRKKGGKSLIKVKHFPKI